MLRCQCLSVCPSVRDGSALAHYSDFRFQIPIPIYCALRSWKGSSPGSVKGSSRAMLATARASCYDVVRCDLKVGSNTQTHKMLFLTVKEYKGDKLLTVKQIQYNSTPDNARKKSVPSC